ncbi:hypothetical protein CYMTET_13230 [Cymbomonas tetramitiformis]|uniref:NAD(P)-binding domain-containing protein n=1 Tax=Cymbomonas tetramitiformis TaxID=36881 RepID=A0AAE0GIW3_9CHLO|nr:hypothetical protein CYMTET_13230 [Cymbomonas tetramitiformis]
MSTLTRCLSKLVGESLRAFPGTTRAPPLWRKGFQLTDNAIPATSRRFQTASFHGNDEGDTQETKEQVSPKVVVFGGNGYVGSEVCKSLLKLGINVTSVSRSGAPASSSSEEWVQHVRWIKGDSLLPDLWKPELHDACGVISTVGAFGSNEFMERACGDTMIEIAKAAAEAKVPRCVYISAHFYELPEFFLKGYVKGKRKGEAAVGEFFPDSGVCIRAGFIHGASMPPHLRRVAHV